GARQDHHPGDAQPGGGGVPLRPHLRVHGAAWPHQGCSHGGRAASAQGPVHDLRQARPSPQRALRAVAGGGAERHGRGPGDGLMMLAARAARATGAGVRALATRLLQAGFVAALVLVWHLVTATGAVSPLFLPKPAEVAASFWAILASGEAVKDIK